MDRTLALVQSGHGPSEHFSDEIVFHVDNVSFAFTQDYMEAVFVLFGFIITLALVGLRMTNASGR